MSREVTRTPPFRAGRRAFSVSGCRGRRATPCACRGGECSSWGRLRTGFVERGCVLQDADDLACGVHAISPLARDLFEDALGHELVDVVLSRLVTYPEF